MALIVQKYGGTSVGSPERIRSVAKRIAEARAQGHGLVVVVSAMGHTTDELIELAEQVSQNPPHREMDMLLTAGERISMALLSMALADLQISAISLTGSQSGIITDDSHRRARIKRILGDRVRSALAAGQVVIVAGFQGVSEKKEITTLGRGGSDTTAVALAAALKADRCEIYTDVDGVFSADPRLVKDARFWRQIPHDLMVEMATRGAGVLHPRSVELAKQYNVALSVKNSLKANHEGTTVKDRQGMEEFSIAAVTSDTGKIFVTLELMRSSVLNSVWDGAQRAHLLIVAPSFAGESVSFFADRDAATDWTKLLQELSVQGFVKKFNLDSELVPLSVIGDRFAQDGGALSEVIEVLSRENITVRAGVASSLALTLAVPANRVNDGVQALHKHFLG